ncbi:adenylate/guanylate cyclase domain-containing protein [Hyphomicrobium methylovorum]|uniref:adenylate/guanylate cyclase domain-containing protein n=1 Tax=Hyphomicrobium methylovorum TaxID=84 RepID=UPI0015E65380|nr:adenylate/guanylate cyclase domain-containing protein [Hyphomicrobium methylovorum]MBA2126686.1 adenylate/guanylate cyclase domain-containing protein [Hyphomicrobium methylovorum]
MKLTRAEQTNAAESRPSNWLARLTGLVRPLRNAFRFIAEIGIKDYPPDSQRRLKIVNVFSSLVVITTFVYAIQLWMSGDEAMMPVVLLNLGLALVVSLVPLMHRFSDIAGGLLLVVAEFTALIGFTAYFGRLGGAPLQYVVAAAAPFVIFEARRFWLVFAIVTSALALHLIAWFSFPMEVARLAADQKIIDSLYVQGAITTFGLISACVYYAFSLVERAKAETETVLRNVLPDEIVERLKAAPGNTIADGFADASVLFADITGFVRLARELGPERTVALLNRLVCAFDDLAEIHGVEKIKTIGDAYMVASGVPVRTPNHAQSLAAMALDIVATLEAISAEENIAIGVRIGMASGPMMAGVIGKNKFSYDVWGDPVNLASRLEQASSPGRITVCPGCYDALKETFVLEPRGEIEIKGVGMQNAWFLNGRRPEISPSNAMSKRA